MKEQDKTLEEELSEVEVGNLPNKQFNEMIIKMFEEMGRRWDEQTEKLEVFNRVRKYKEEQTEVKNTITKMKNTLEGINSRLDDTEDRISELEEKVVEVAEAEQKKE